MTVKEIAKLANVSPATVSNVLNHRNNVGEETRQRILEICKENGYDINKGKIRSRQKIPIPFFLISVIMSVTFI